MRLTVAVQCRRLGIVTETNRAVLVGDTSERNSLSHVKVSAKKPLAKKPLMTVVAVDRAISLLHGCLQLRLQPRMRFEVVWRVGQNDLAVPADADPIIGIGQIFGRKPEVQRVFCN